MTNAHSPLVPHKGPVVAALDLGSNSFHLVVVLVRHDRSFDIVASEKRMLRLGEEVARTGRISDASVDLAVKTVVELTKVATSAGAEEIWAFATSAFRDAENSDEVVAAIEAVSGVHAHVVSGLKEAQTIYHAVRSHLSLEPSPTLVADMGGGSLELIVGDQRQSYFTTSLPLGVGRLKVSFGGSDPISTKDLRRIRAYVASVLAPSLSRISEFDPRSLVLSSGTFGALLKMAQLSETGDLSDVSALEGSQVDLRLVRRLGQSLLKLPAQKRLQLPGAEERRVDLLPLGWLVLEQLLTAVDVNSGRFSSWALREGMVLDALEARSDFEFAFDSSELRSGSVRSLAERYRSLDGHSTAVKAFALTLADAVDPIAHFSPLEKELLGHAATLHDIGEWISREGHERHGAYVVDASVLKGFSEFEKAYISSMIRFHKRGVPKPADHLPFQRLKPKDRTQVVKLASILRIADSLDRSHGEVVKEIEAEVVSKTLVIYAKTVEDISLEINGFRKKKGLFEETFGITAEIYPTNPTDLSSGP